MTELENTQRRYPQLKPWQIIALEQMKNDLASIEFERRMDMNTRSTGEDTGPGQEKVPEVRAQLENTEATVGRLAEAVSQVMAKFRPVLAEVGGEKATAEETVCHVSLAPLAEDIAAIEERITIEIRRLKHLVHRCEV